MYFNPNGLKLFAVRVVLEKDFHGKVLATKDTKILASTVEDVQYKVRKDFPLARDMFIQRV
jgi:hypothetical protein